MIFHASKDKGVTLMFHSRDFPFPIFRDPDDFAIPAFPGNRVRDSREYDLLIEIVYSSGISGIFHQLLQICLKLNIMCMKPLEKSLGAPYSGN
jgi:hypothetical protein